MKSDDYSLVELADGNIGQHAVIGLKTKSHYGYRKSGDRFLMHRDDIPAHTTAGQRMGRVLVVMPEPVLEPEPDVEVEPDVDSITVDWVDGVPSVSAISLLTERQIAEFERMGVQSVKDLLKLSDEELVSIKGIGEVKAKQIRMAAERLLNA